MPTPTPPQHEAQSTPRLWYVLVKRISWKPQLDTELYVGASAGEGLTPVRGAVPRDPCDPTGAPLPLPSGSLKTLHYFANYVGVTIPACLFLNYGPLCFRIFDQTKVDAAQYLSLTIINNFVKAKTELESMKNWKPSSGGAIHIHRPSGTFLFDCERGKRFGCVIDGWGFGSY